MRKSELEPCSILSEFKRTFARSISLILMMFRRSMHSAMKGTRAYSFPRPHGFQRKAIGLDVLLCGCDHEGGAFEEHEDFEPFSNEQMIFNDKWCGSLWPDQKMISLHRTLWCHEKINRDS